MKRTMILTLIMLVSLVAVPLMGQEQFTKNPRVQWQTEFNLWARGELGFDLDDQVLGFRNMVGANLKLTALPETTYRFEGTHNLRAELEVKDVKIESTGAEGAGITLSIGNVNARLFFMNAYLEFFSGSTPFTSPATLLNEESLRRATRVVGYNSVARYGSQILNFISPAEAADGQLKPQIPTFGALKIGYNMPGYFDASLMIASEKSWQPSSVAGAGGWANEDQQNNFVLQGAFRWKDEVIPGLGAMVTGLVPLGSDSFTNTHSTAFGASINYEHMLGGIYFLEPSIGVDVKLPAQTGDPTLVAIGGAMRLGWGGDIKDIHTTLPMWETKLPGIMLSGNVLNTIPESGDATQKLNLSLTTYHNANIIENLRWDLGFEIKDLDLVNNDQAIIGTSAYVDYMFRNFGIENAGIIRPWLSTTYWVSLSETPTGAATLYRDGALHVKTGVNFESLIPGMVFTATWNSNDLIQGITAPANRLPDHRFGELVFGVMVNL